MSLFNKDTQTYYYTYRIDLRIIVIELNVSTNITICCHLNLLNRFQCLQSFLAQCQQKGLLDKSNVDQILSHRKRNADLLDTSVKSDRNPLGNVINAGKTISLACINKPWTCPDFI